MPEDKQSTVTSEYILEIGKPFPAGADWQISDPYLFSDLLKRGLGCVALVGRRYRARFSCTQPAFMCPFDRRDRSRDSVSRCASSLPAKSGWPWPRDAIWNRSSTAAVIC